jgi:uncharacterized protein
MKPSRPAVITSAAAATAVGVALYATAIRPRRVRLRRETLELPRWPATLDGLKVAVIADLHAGALHVKERQVKDAVARVNAERPDVCLLLGDYIDPTALFAREVPVERVAAALAELRAPLGVLAVIGNHDRRYGGELVAEALRDAGIPVLRDEARHIDVGGERVAFVGLREGERRPRREGSLPIPDEGDATIVLSHVPDVFPRIPDRVALTVSGHTHGAQVDLPGLRTLITPSRYGARYKAGHIVEDGRHLYVCRGVGTSHLPVRLGAPPEISLLTLRSTALPAREASP